MKVLKFVIGGGEEPPDTYYIEETLGFNASFVVTETKVHVYETLGLKVYPEKVELFEITETIGLGDVEFWDDTRYINEIIGFNDAPYQPDWAGAIANIGLNDTVQNFKTITIQVEENFGFSDTVGVYSDITYSLTWRTRTKKLNYGYGTAGYGDSVSYGDGDVTDELAKFRVKVIRLSDDTLLRTDDITINDTTDPDADASYEYSVAMNISDNGYYEPNLRFEVYQVDVNDNVSPVNYIDITPSWE